MTYDDEYAIFEPMNGHKTASKFDKFVVAILFLQYECHKTINLQCHSAFEKRSPRPLFHYFQIAKSLRLADI